MAYWGSSAAAGGLTFISEAINDVSGGGPEDDVPIPAEAKWFSVALSLSHGDSGVPADLQVIVMHLTGGPAPPGPSWVGTFPLGSVVDVPQFVGDGVSAPDTVVISSTGGGATKLYYWVRFYK